VDHAGNHIDGHGNRESGAAWYGWVPTLARRYRVVRPDTRGFGKSTPVPRDFPWTLDRGFLPVAVTDTETCARATLNFIAENGG